MKKRSIGVLLSYANTIISMICGLVLSSYLLHSLGDTEFGVYKTIASFANYLIMLEFGTGTIMQRQILIAKRENDFEKEKKALSTIWFITIFLSFLILAVSSVLYFCIPFIYSKTMSSEQASYAQVIFIFLTVYLVIVFLTQTLNGVLIGNEQYTFTQSTNIIKTIVRAFLLIAILIFIKYSIVIAVVDFAVSLLAFLVTFIYCKIRYKIFFQLKFFDFAILKDALPLCLALLLQSLIDQANSNVDSLVIGITMSVEAVSLYAVTQYIYFMFVSICIAPVTLFLPQISKNMSRGLSDREFTDSLIPACRLTTVIAGSILFGFFACGKQFVSILYGPSKVSAWYYALIILFPMFINETNFVIVNVLDLTKKRLFRSIALGITAVCNIILTLVFIHYWGIIGAVIATAISLLLGNILLMNIYYHKALKIHVLHLFIESYKGILPIQILSSIIAFFIGRQITSIYASFFAAGMVYILFSGGLILLLGLNKTEKEFIKHFLHRKKSTN